MKLVGMITTTLVVGLIAIIEGGYVLSLLWGWLITPTFPSLPTLSITQAIGVQCVVGFFKYTPSTKSEEASVMKWREALNILLAIILVTYPFTILVGYLIHKCM